ncbi:MAG TPA: glucuronate isomerase [Cyclobacteriaceae bacterium]|jgi:glucuronate isomerase|nr:glucuronate isomerase [Cyclobacteriaceae bacterium]
MKNQSTFLSENFLLETEASILLYKQHASPAPILDYHNHLSPKEIAENRRFNNLTEIWLEGDHYKWRAMRFNGITEKYCTGNASPVEKFEAWAKTVPYTLRNPLYHWTHLELKNYFGITKLLNETTAKEIYEECTSKLQQEDFRVQSLLSKMKVQVVCTTDDPTDNLEYHQKFAKQNGPFKMYPSFRPDKCYSLDDLVAYNKYIDLLAEASSTHIHSFDDLIEALKKRIKFFDEHGCRSSDHGPESLFFDANASSAAPTIFKKVRERIKLTVDEQQLLRCAILIELCKLYHEIGWAQQFHLGALRGNNSRKAREVGADSGFDSIGEFPQAVHLSKFFNHLDNTDQLTRTIIYNSNPAHNEVFGTMIGNFCDGSEPGKMQFGSGWWFLDQKDGMEKQLNTLSNMALLSRFVGMVTDSRSFLSFSRHEYFRRILCNLIGRDVERGEIPNDMALLGKMVGDICYSNAKDYFRF